MEVLVCRPYKILIAGMLYAWVNNYGIGIRGIFCATYPYDTVSISFLMELLSHLYGKICGWKHIIYTDYYRQIWGISF